MDKKRKKLEFFSNHGKNSNFFIAGDVYSLKSMPQKTKKLESFSSTAKKSNFPRLINFSRRAHINRYEAPPFINFGRRALLNNDSSPYP